MKQSEEAECVSGVGRHADGTKTEEGQGGLENQGGGREPGPGRRGLLEVYESTLSGSGLGK